MRRLLLSYRYPHNSPTIGMEALVMMKVPGILATIFATILPVFLFLHASSAWAQCSKDADCKGERICTSGICVDPPYAPSQGVIAAPASGAGVVPALPVAPPSYSLPPSCVCQPGAVYTVPPVGFGVPGPAPLAGSFSVGPSEYGGAFVRVSAGLGYFRTDFSHDQAGAYSASSYAGSFSGTAISLGAAVGGSVSRQVVVFGEILGSFLSDPSADSGAYQGYTLETWTGNYGLVSIGPGVSYYFEQSNAYISGTLTITRLFGKEIDSKAGLGANFAIGEDWRASPNLRFGVVAGVQMATADDNYRGTATTLVPALRFSIIWN